MSTLVFIIVSGLAILFVVFVEAAGVFWFYGVDNFSADIEQMLGKKPSLFWRICWRYISPTFLFVSLIKSWEWGGWEGIGIIKLTIKKKLNSGLDWNLVNIHRGFSGIWTRKLKNTLEMFEFLSNFPIFPGDFGLFCSQQWTHVRRRIQISVLGNSFG